MATKNMAELAKKVTDYINRNGGAVLIHLNRHIEFHDIYDAMTEPENSDFEEAETPTQANDRPNVQNLKEDDPRLWRPADELSTEDTLALQLALGGLCRSYSKYLELRNKSLEGRSTRPIDEIERKLIAIAKLYDDLVTRLPGATHYEPLPESDFDPRSARPSPFQGFDVQGTRTGRWSSKRSNVTEVPRTPDDVNDYQPEPQIDTVDLFVRIRCDRTHVPGWGYDPQDMANAVAHHATNMVLSAYDPEVLEATWQKRVTDEPKEFRFDIRRRHGDTLETIAIVASDSHEAVRQLPPCVTWDFSLRKPDADT